MKRQRKFFATLILTLLLILVTGVSVSAATNPGAVRLTKITATDYNKINIKWKKASGATNYIVYYRKNGADKWTKIKTLDSSKSSYTHTSSSKYPIIVGQKYQYTVKAYNSKTKKSGNYNTKGLTANTIPQQSNFYVAGYEDSLNGVLLEWNKAKGADSYIIYCKSADDSSWIKIATVKSTSYVDKIPNKRPSTTYTVRSYNSKLKIYGKYNKFGVYAFIPDIDDDDDDNTDVSPTPTPTVTPVKPKPTSTPRPTPTEKPQPTITPKPTDIPTPTPNPVHRPDQAEINQMVQEVIRLTNIERAKVGSAPLQYHEGLEKAAMVRAKELDTLFSHTRPDGSDSSTATAEFGVGGDAGENIAMGYDSPEAVMKGWLNSPGHRAALLSKGETHIGVGFYQNAYGTYFWTQNFAENPDRKCTLTVDANGGFFPDGSSLYTVQFPYLSRINFAKDITTPSKEGKSFAGWSWYDEVIPGIGLTIDTEIKTIWNKKRTVCIQVQAVLFVRAML